MKRSSSERRNGRMNRTLVLALTGAMLLSLSFSISAWLQAGSGKRIAYVRTGELVNNYLGTRELKSTLEEKSQMLRNNVGTLERELQAALADFQQVAGGLGREELQARRQALLAKDEELKRYADAAGSRSQQEQATLTSGVLKQINSFLKEYGALNDYDIIFGTTLDGSLLYGAEAIDITAEVLAVLNSNYEGAL